MTTEPTTEAVEAFLRAYTGDFEFLCSVRDQLAERGTITERQTAGVIRCMPKPRKARTTGARPSASAPAIDREALIARVPGVNDQGKGGRYAVPTGTGEVLFVRVQHVTEPGDRWDGWTFVKRIMAGDQLAKLVNVRPDGTVTGEPQGITALMALVADPLAAMLRFGQERQRCGCCGIVLDKKISRKTGIGPVCAENHGVDREALYADWLAAHPGEAYEDAVPPIAGTTLVIPELEAFIAAVPTRPVVTRTEAELDARQALWDARANEDAPF